MDCSDERARPAAAAALYRQHLLDDRVRPDLPRIGKDDVRIAVKSSAIAPGSRTRPCLFVFYAAALLRWGHCSIFAGLPCFSVLSAPFFNRRDCCAVASP